MPHTSHGRGDSLKAAVTAMVEGYPGVQKDTVKARTHTCLARDPGRDRGRQEGGGRATTPARDQKGLLHVQRGGRKGRAPTVAVHADDREWPPGTNLPDAPRVPALTVPAHPGLQRWSFSSAPTTALALCAATTATPPTTPLLRGAC